MQCGHGQRPQIGASPPEGRLVGFAGTPLCRKCTVKGKHKWIMCSLNKARVGAVGGPQQGLCGRPCYGARGDLGQPERGSRNPEVRTGPGRPGLSESHLPSIKRVCFTVE